MSAECLKAAGYLDTKDQDKISYMFIPPKKHLYKSWIKPNHQTFRWNSNFCTWKKSAASSEKYKKQREANAKKQKNKTVLIDGRTYQQLKDDDFISLAPKNKSSLFIDDRTCQELKDDDVIALESDEEVKEITDVRKKQKQKIETKKKKKNYAENKNKTIAANKILKN